MTADLHVFDLLPAYALDCLDEDEAVYVSEHLATCAECNSELEVYQVIADNLPLAVPLVDPPAVMKDRLMERIQSGSSRGVSQPQPDTQQKPRPRNLFWMSPVLAFASLVIILALIGSNIYMWSRMKQLNTAYPQPVMQIVNLQGTQDMPQATGMIVISQDGDHGTLVVDHLKPLAQNRQYQLWLIVNGDRTSGGVFSVDGEGYGSLWVNSPQPLKDYASFGVTIEPNGGSSDPTGEKVLGGNLSQ